MVGSTLNYIVYKNVEIFKTYLSPPKICVKENKNKKLVYTNTLFFNIESQNFIKSSYIYIYIYMCVCVCVCVCVYVFLLVLKLPMFYKSCPQVVNIATWPLVKC